MKRELETDELVQRKMERRRNIAPKSLSEVSRPLYEAQFQAPEKHKDGDNTVTMKAKCPHFAGRMITVGGTAFKFDENGICTWRPNYRANCVRDFQQLVKLPGVEEIVEASAAEVLADTTIKTVTASEIPAVKPVTPSEVAPAATKTPTPKPVETPKPATPQVSVPAKPVEAAVAVQTPVTAAPVTTVTPAPVQNGVESDGDDQATGAKGRRSRKQP